MKYDFIDSLRGIAILLVIQMHVLQSLSLPNAYFSYSLQYGQMGVQLFFIVSAYTLCMSFDKRKNESRPILNFFIRRYFRIAPFYYIAILGYFLLRSVIATIKNGEPSLPTDYTVINVLANLTFAHGLYEPANNTIVPGGWSIGTEMLFYLVFPFIFMFIGKKANNKVLIMTLPLIVFIIVFLLIDFSGYSIINNGIIYFSLLNQAPVFCTGIALYLLQKKYPLDTWHINSGLLLAFYFIVTQIAIYIGWISSIENAFVIVPFVSSLSFVALFIIFKRHDRLNTPALRRIGQRSYSMYLIHFFFAHQVSKVLNQAFLVDMIGQEASFFVTYIMTIICTYYVAGITFTYIETYFINKGRELINIISNKSMQASTNI